MQKKMRVADDTTLIITTYNKPVFLELVLKSVMRQRVLPCEVIVADDGSKEDTKALIERYQALFPVPLVHSWIPDEGFRLSMSRNVAIAKAKGDYIIIATGAAEKMIPFLGMTPEDLFDAIMNLANDEGMTR